MDEKVLYIIIGIIVLVNIFFLFIAMSRKKTQSSPKQSVKETASGNDRDNAPVDEHAKTEVLGGKRKSAPVSSSKQSSVEAELSQNISNFTNEERNAIKHSSLAPANETVLMGNSENATQLMTPELPFAFLKYTDNGETKEFPIDKERTVIGRELDACDLTLLNDNFVGRTHAILYMKEDQFFLADLNSKNGTFINNQPLKGQKEIFFDTKIRVGKTDLELVKS